MSLISRNDNDVFNLQYHPYFLSIRTVIVMSRSVGDDEGITRADTRLCSDQGCNLLVVFFLILYMFLSQKWNSKCGCRF